MHPNPRDVTCPASRARRLIAHPALSLAAITAAMLFTSGARAQLNITRQPESLMVPSGQPATLSVGVTASPAPTYQWRRYGYPIPGATAASYQIPAVRQFDNDFYDVVVTSGGTTAVSESARLLVTLPSYPNAATVDLSRSYRLEGRNAPPGVNSPLTGLAALPDGRFYLAGAFSSIDGQPRRDLVRFQANGTVDTTFTPPAFDQTPRGLLLQPDGKLVVTGLFKTVNGVPTGGIVRLNPDGSRDDSFAVGSGFSLGVWDRAFLAPNGSIYVTGSGLGSYQGSAFLYYVARLTPTGALDTSFSAPTFSVGISGTNPSGFAIGPSGEIYVHGGFDAVNGVSRNRMARLLPNGQLDPTFNPGAGPNNWIYAMIVLANGQVVISGDLTAYNGTPVGHIARINPNGSLDPTFATGSGFAQQVNFLAELPNNMLFVGSPFNTYNGTFVGAGVRLAANGALDPTFAYGPTGRPEQLFVLPGNRLLVSAVGLTEFRPAVRVLEPNGAISASVARPDLRFPAHAQLLAPLPGGKVLVAGDFTHVNGVAAPFVMRLNADLSRDTTFPNGPGPTSYVTRGVVQPDGKIVLFTADGMLRLNADGSTDATFSTQAPGGYWYPCRPVVLGDGRLFVPTTSPTWWGGSAVTSGFVVLEPNGTRATNHPFLPGPNAGARVSGVQRLPGGQLLVFGSFTSWNGISRANAVRLNADGSVDPTWTYSGDLPINGFFPPLARNGWSIQRDGRLLLSAETNTPGDSVARFSLNGSRDRSFASGLPRLSSTPNILIQPDDRVLLSAQGEPRIDGNLPAHFYRLAPNGGIDGSFALRGSGVWFDAMLADNGELLSSDDSGYVHRYIALPPPTITTQPSAQSVVAGTNILLSVAATGDEPLTYQWLKDGAPITGATSATLTLNAVPLAGAGSYSVLVRNAGGTVTSQAVTVAVSARPVPGAYFGTFGGSGGTFALYVRENGTGAFLAYLADAKVVFAARNVSVGADRRLRFIATSISGTAAMSMGEVDGAIAADGSVAATFLGRTFTAPPATTSGATSSLVGFYEAGVPNDASLSYTIVGANGAAYTVAASPTVADAASVSVDAAGTVAGTTASNTRITGTIQPAGGLGIVTFTPAIGQPLMFLGADNERRSEVEALLNISTRGLISAASPSFTAGFVVTGTTAKTVLVRGIGPSLAQFNISGALTAARLEVFRGSIPLVVGNDWGLGTNAALIALTAARVGAFPLAPGSRDAALLLTLEPGAYSAILSGQTGATGLALVEVYDATQGAVMRGEHIVNISTLGIAGTGQDVLAAGFYVSGIVPKRVLIRGAGPGLAQFGVAGAIGRPQVAVYSGSTRLAENAGWSASADANAIALAASQVGAFAFPNGSADSALVLNLPPGSYTAQVSNLGGTTGPALVEIYEVP